MKAGVVAICVAMLIAAFYGGAFALKESSVTSSVSINSRLAPSSLDKLSLVQGHAYTGAYIDFGDSEDDVTLDAIQKFEKLVGKQQAIVASSSYWGKDTFPLRNMNIISAYGAVPLLFWLPWDREQYESTKFNKFDLPSIAQGKFDVYIEKWADEAKKFGKPMLVAWGIEMNGNWFPWSGFFYGAGREILSADGTRYEGPENFKAAYRHIVDKVRSQGASNIEWVFHVNNSSDPEEPWNRMAMYYPGDNYVDWVGASAYGQQYAKGGWAPFEIVLPRYYKEIFNMAPSKPMILAEFGLANLPNSGNMAGWIREAFRRLPVEFPSLRAAVYWHERWENGDGTISNLRVNATEESLLAYRAGVANPFWLGRPQFVPRANDNIQ